MSLKFQNDPLPSFDNVPEFPEKTLIALDVSASMIGKPLDTGALFAAVLLKKNINSDLLIFHDDAVYLHLNRNDSVTTLTRLIKDRYCGGTDFNTIFKTADKPYKRIIILSDMQGWIGYYSPKESFKQYKRKFDCDPIVYSFDLQGYGTLQFPERNVYCLAGFSEKIFDIMSLLEQDKSALINEINKVLI